MDEDRENQLAELEALESVLREGKLLRLAETSGIITLDFDVTNIKIYGTLENGERFENELKFLPPAKLRFDFPADYPSVSTPKFEIQTDWLTKEQTSKCLEEMRQICEENESMPVLYFCYDKLMEIVAEIGTNNKIVLNDALVLEVEKNLTISQLRNRVIGQSEDESAEHFNNANFECKICYDEVLGEHCHQFQPCGHVFCISCIENYFECLVNNNLPNSLKCLAEGCTTPCEHAFIQKVLKPAEFLRYESILLEKAIQEIDDAVQCPREDCAKVAYLTDPSKNLVECTYCSSSFCNLCKQTFHGISGCKFKQEDKTAILEKWRESGLEERKEMAKNFGGMRNLEIIIENFENDEWKDANSKQCPKCCVSIEKNDGCHKMHCTKCDTYFCWLCQKVLHKNDPYQHFRGDGECAGRLFEGVDGADPEDDDDEHFDRQVVIGDLVDVDFDEEDDDVEFVLNFDDFNEAFDDGSGEEEENSEEEEAE
ncbi:unnamed protein product [Caenorhabditis angaria]|uniref:RBR-type E3 ubiquitin transferase n=1 Tax=Caenorhabditis angaria TaxID=860376 RepID=A0A9P1IFL1_9PELO|nr:unnamed protein product [Caenorhabditis angaria]